MHAVRQLSALAGSPCGELIDASSGGSSKPAQLSGPHDVEVDAAADAFDVREAMELPHLPTVIGGSSQEADLPKLPVQASTDGVQLLPVRSDVEQHVPAPLLLNHPDGGRDVLRDFVGWWPGTAVPGQLKVDDGWQRVIVRRRDTQEVARLLVASGA
jgi:hypothetical protein